MNSTQPPPMGESRSVLDWALEYRRRGWSVIPIARDTKRPPKRFRWKKFQKTLPTEDEVRDWFGGRDDLGIAVICGSVSGNLVCRDFDDAEAYERWSAEYPKLASTLPTVRTARGWHVYFRAEIDGIKHFDDGELRAGGYCLLPPSVHPSGESYAWDFDLPKHDLPTVDPFDAGLTSAHVTERTEDNGGERKQGGGSVAQVKASVAQVKASVAQVKASVAQGEASVAQVLPTVARGAKESPFSSDVLKAIETSLPTTIGNRNRQVFELARALKAIPHLVDADPVDLEEIVREWHAQGLARGVIGTEPFDETLIDFLIAWPKVKFPKGEEPMIAIVDRARSAVLPEFAKRYESDGVRLLLAICRELQLVSGDNPFFLSCRTAGELLGVTHVHAWRWLTLLESHKVIQKVGKADRPQRRAQRYRYTAA